MLTFHGEVLFHVMLADGRVVPMKRDELHSSAPNVYIDYMEHRLLNPSINIVNQ
jgi:hypothetical protein